MLTSLDPSSVAVFQAPEVKITGSDLGGVSSVTLAGVQLPALTYRIVSPSEIRLTPPTGSTLGAEALTVANAQGSSNMLNLNRHPTIPMRASASPFVVAGLPVTWTFGGDPDDRWFLFVAFNDNTTFPLFGQNLLLNSFFVAQGTLDGRGLGQHTAPTPPSPRLSGVTLYGQIIGLDQALPVVNGATNLGVTRFF